MAVIENTRIIEQDVVKVAPDKHQVLIDNDKVRVMVLRLRPGDELPMHSHPALVSYAFEDAKNIWTEPDGTSRNIEMKAGQAMYSRAMAHSVVNTGDTDTHILVIEMKKPR